MIQQYRVPRDTLTALCAGAGSSADITLLWSGQLSKRLLQLKAIVDAAEYGAGRLAHIEESYRSLVVLQRHQPHVVAELLLAPQVGAWASECLRRLTYDLVERGDHATLAPVWVDLAHLGAIAAAAALRTGVELQVSVPARAGAVILPTLGRLRVPSRAPWELARFELSAGLAQVHLAGHHTVLPRRWHADSPGWEPVWRLHTRAASDSHVVDLDDLDPYWQCFRLPLAARLRPDAVGSWQYQLAQAWRILAARHLERLSALRASLRCLVPLASKPERDRLSATSRHAAGALALTEPVHDIDMAATLVHEIQHFKLNALHDLQPLYHPDDKQLYYSPWRQDPRPLSALLHGVYAFLGVAEFMYHERVRGGLWGAETELTFACCAERLRIAYQQAVTAPGLTSLGERLIEAMGPSIDELHDEVPRDDIRRQAEKLVALHHTEWTLRHGTV